MPDNNSNNKPQQSFFLYHLCLIPLIISTLMGSLLLLFCDINDFLALIFFLYVGVIVSCVLLYQILVKHKKDNISGVINTTISIYISYLAIKLLFFNYSHDTFLIVGSILMAISAISMLACSIMICLKNNQPFLYGVGAGIMSSIIINFLSSFF